MSSKLFVQKLFFPVALTGVFFINACNAPEKKTEDAIDSTAMNADTVAVLSKDTTSEVIADFPPVSEVPALLKLSGVDFNQTLLNSPDKAKNYTTTADRSALNLGVYASDLGYLAAYGKTQPAITYIHSSNTLADHLGINTAYGAAMQKRFEQNISSTDSLAKIIDEGMHSANKFLKENDQKSTAALALTGGFIEGLYISTGLIETYPKNVPANVRDQALVSLIKTILKQKQTVADLIALLKASGQDAQITEYVTSLEELHKKFEAVNFDKMISDNKGDLIVTDKTLADIAAQVKQIRAKIVG
ncbi:MAG: hypothetical protein V4714_22350 [Bacteroidota bacterium]